MRDEASAIDAIKEYEIVMGDPWRDDYCESPEERDQCRYGEMIDAVAAALGLTDAEAVKFYREYSR